jgi:hypothetical protein
MGILHPLEAKGSAGANQTRFARYPTSDNVSYVRLEGRISRKLERFSQTHGAAAKESRAAAKESRAAAKESRAAAKESCIDSRG